MKHEGSAPRSALHARLFSSRGDEKRVEVGTLGEVEVGLEARGAKTAGK